MASRRKTKRKPTKARVTRAGPKKSGSARAARPAGEGEREVHYTDLRKVMLENALKRLR
jgi:molybdopterin/thiamine biosynthesis adenylyltransferase